VLGGRAGNHPKHVSTLPVYRPLGSTIAVHSAVPLPGRDVVVMNDEALREYCDEPASYAATVDISDESDPIMMALFPQPRPPRGYDVSGSERCTLPLYDRPVSSNYASDLWS
jgi:hypothetical protein